MRFEQLTLAGIAALHLGVGLTHTYSHAAADVPIPAVHQVYIVIVVTLMPLAAVWLAFRRSLRLGVALFAASMYASFVFGYLMHFVLDSPDLHSNIVGDSAGVFFHTALSLALVEFVGFAFGLVAAVRRIR
ncbi:hypothetical protein [Candidatus Poriferisodalis sp.]|uniref:hypothetical protein n=1 Tax=Candidatus Poriferisodalis sp. TaxID=3101277 RepID=UPI003C705B55